MVKVSMKDSAPTYVIKLRTGDVVVGNFGSVWGIGATLYRAEEPLGKSPELLRTPSTGASRPSKVNVRSSC